MYEERRGIGAFKSRLNSDMCLLVNGPGEQRGLGRLIPEITNGILWVLKGDRDPEKVSNPYSIPCLDLHYNSYQLLHASGGGEIITSFLRNSTKCEKFLFVRMEPGPLLLLSIASSQSNLFHIDSVIIRPQVLVPHGY